MEESQPTYSGLGGRKQTPLRASTVQVMSVVSCLFNLEAGGKKWI